MNGLKPPMGAGMPMAPHPFAPQMPASHPTGMMSPHFGTQPNFQLKQTEHLGTNPVHVAHLEKAFAVHPAKIHSVGPAAPMPPGTGSPWTSMVNK